MSKKNINVVLGVTGSISCYKSIEIASELTKRGINVYTILSKSAQNFITSLAFDEITKNITLTNSPGEEVRNGALDHVSLGKKANMFLIAPATANIISKLANGQSSDNITAVSLVCRCPVLIAPAMNTNMWEHQATTDNIKKLKSYGYKIIDPEVGQLACGDYGIGRLTEPDKIIKICLEILKKL